MTPETPGTPDAAGSPDAVAVVNASPLIFLAKIDRLGILPRPSLTTPTVLQEVRAGGRETYPEVETVEHLVRKGTLQVAEPEGDAPTALRDHAGIDAGEASILHLARGRSISRVVVDDRVAIRVAKLLDLDPASTPYLLLRACRRDELPYHAFQRSLDHLLDHGYHLSRPLYRELLQAAREADPDEDESG